MRGMSKDVPEESILEYVKSYQAKRWSGYEGKIITIPTKLIYGNLDPVIIPEYFTGIDKCFEDIDIIELETGHFVMDEKPIEVAKILSEYFI